MSIAEDIENLYDDGFYETDDEIFKEYLLGELHWKTKGKSEIHISKMTDSHIINCMKIPLYLNKKNWDIVFKYELNRRNAIK
jgi:hypothetical protein